MDWHQHVGGRIREIRERQHLTQEEVAAEASTDLSYYRGIEAGKRNASLAKLILIANALGVKVPELFF
ncbi:helix-turn-helix transcriptional regulator [Caulobacter sp. 73W]|uniref:Helix-turn-helix transcriptional regulator n=1 Tax=Caulobacter sp. 73W TaxID=3161137 RepID=A0AB39KZE5_9CAUL